MTTSPFLIPNIQHHKLHCTWTFSYCIPPNTTKGKAEQWDRYLHPFTDFCSFEDFYGILNSIEKPATLPVGCRYYVFKKGIKPIWEDKANEGGYAFSVEYDSQVKKGKGKKPTKDKSIIAEDKWMDLTLTMLTNNFPNVDKVNGIEFNHRKSGFRIGVWTKRIDQNEKTALETDIKKLLGEEAPPMISVQLTGPTAPTTHTQSQ